MGKSSFGNRPGNANLRGKRSMTLPCRCCTVTDLRPRLLERAAAHDAHEALTGDDNAVMTWGEDEPGFFEGSTLPDPGEAPGA